MLQQRTFNIVLVSKHQPVGFSNAAKPVRSLQYDGKALDVPVP